MRLIDADKLKEELEVNGLGYQYYMLDNAPTVKVIPIEWLLSILSNSYNEIMEDDEDDYIQGFEDGWNACLKAIKKELDCWEKENE